MSVVVVERKDSYSDWRGSSSGNYEQKKKDFIRPLVVVDKTVEQIIRSCSNRAKLLI